MALAFDAKEFKRESYDEGRKLTFYTPLGIGIEVDNLAELKEAYIKICKEKHISHAIFENYSIFSSGLLCKKYDHNRVSGFLESILYGIKDYIKQINVIYVIISPKNYPDIIVGGHYSPSIPVNIFDFFRRLSPSFSYITAWKYLQNNKTEKEILLDAFSGKQTLAWEEMKKYKIKIFPRGDECNLLISIADAIAFTLDRRISRMKLRLEPDGIEKALEYLNIDWKYDVITPGDIGSIRWYNFDDIIWSEYQARPILFIDLDAINMRTMVELEAYQYATKYSYEQNGSLQGFDEHIDTKRIRNGDIYVYAGEQARNRALTFADIYDIEILSVKELKSKI
jgi:hypothetical protein